MKLNALTPLALLCCLAAPATPSFAQGQSSAAATRIAVVQPGRIFAEMQETQDLKVNLESERVRLTSMEKEKRDALQALQNQRNQLKADTPQWEELNNKLMDAALEFQLWGQQTKAKAERNQKRQMKQLFERIEQAVGEVAVRDGFDVVLADQHPELPENLDQINFDQLRALINSRSVLYTAKKADISDGVIALLYSKSTGRGGTGAAPRGGGSAQPAAAAPQRRPAPAPAPRQ